MNLIRFTIYLSICMSFTACGSKSTYLNFESTPKGAEILVKPVSQQEFKKIGLTPMNIRADELEKKYGGSGPITVKYEKPGYYPSTLIITELSAIDLTIMMDLSSESGLDDQRKLNWVIDSMFEIKRLVSAKRYEDALKILNKVKETVPQVAAVYELEGGIFFLQQRYPAAYDSYSAAVRYNPKNLENIRMKELCKKKMENR